MAQRTLMRFVFSLTIGLTGCSGESSLLSSTGPTPTLIPSPTAPSPVPSVPPDLWTLTGTYAGHTGPEACLRAFDGAVQVPIQSVITIIRSGESIEVLTEH